MKVKELIEKLSKVDGEAQVVIMDSDYDGVDNCSVGLCEFSGFVGIVPPTCVSYSFGRYGVTFKFEEIK